jgi:RNA polymerase sigma-70 factor, ECF subfamily
MSTSTPEILSSHRTHLLRYARRQLRDAALAEDVVHDALAVALGDPERFGGRSSLRTWLVGILKHKIVDAIRQRAGECSLEAMQGDHDDAAAAPLPALIDRVDPSLLAEQRQTLRHTLARLEALPLPLRRTFEMSVVFGHSTAEVCAAMDISEGNLWVRLHRVRKELLAA